MIQACFTSERQRDSDKYDAPPPPEYKRELEQGLATSKRYRPDWLEEGQGTSQLLLP